MIKKILFLEDEEVLGRLYTKHLKGAGFAVDWIKSTLGIENKAKQSQADLIILDHSISGENRSGISLIPILKQLLPKAQIVMLSNFSSFQLSDEAFKAGAADYIVKLNMPPAALAAHIKGLFSKPHVK